MTARHGIAVGCALGLITSGIVVALMWFRVSGVLRVGQTDLMYVLWPSSVMLIVGWRNTLPGIAITLFSVILNCFTYIAVVLLLRAGISLIARPKAVRE